MENKKIEFATKALILRDGKYLVLHKKEADHDFYELPGGRMEFGETAEETLKREIMEETNFIVEPIKLLDTWTYIGQNYQIAGIIYLCRVAQGEFKLSEEHDKYQWLELNTEGLNIMHEIFRERMINWNMDKIIKEIGVNVDDKSMFS